MWSVLASEGSSVVLYVYGWLPDSDAIRWALAAALRVEGYVSPGTNVYETAYAATIDHGHIGTADDLQETIVDENGVNSLGDLCSDVAPVTLAHVHEF